MTGIRDLPPLRDVLHRYGLTANKNFGQHFLFDLNLTDKIARLAAPHDTIVEIGPGPGGLTRSLLMAGTGRLIAIEKDRRFIPVLKEIEKVAPGPLTIVEGDALKIDIGQISNDYPLRICANLPYNVGTKLLINWLTASPVFWDRLVVMLQKEVAERIVAKAGDNAYGRLAVLASSVATPHLAFDVPARAFTPPPKVDSAVVVLDVLPPDDRFTDLDTLARITETAFGQRRKMLRKSLRPLAKRWNICLETWLDTANVAPDIRPEVLDIAGFHSLVRVAKALTQARS